MKSRTLLLVDNDASFLGALKGLLERHGYQIAKACGASEAAQAITEESFDLLLTDAMFPGRRSIEALIALGKRPAPALVIALNSRGRHLPDYYLALTRKLRVERIIEKPIAEDQLLAAIEEVFARAELPPLSPQGAAAGAA
jgi:CheY-like chemotaxis protein